MLDSEEAFSSPEVRAGHQEGVLMRRLPILLILALVVTVLALAPVSAGKWTCDDKPDHPNCTTTSPPDCDFDSTTGVLENWDKTAPFQCVWKTGVPGATFSFQIQSLDSSASEVLLPHLIVNEDDDFPSTICFKKSARGPQELPFPQDDLWTFSPADVCSDDGEYLMTVSVKPVKTGNVDFVMVPVTSS